MPLGPWDRSRGKRRHSNNAYNQNAAAVRHNHMLGGCARLDCMEKSTYTAKTTMEQKSYSYPQSDGSIFMWKVERLLQLAQELPIKSVPLSSIEEFDTVYWFEGPEEIRPTCRAVVDHAKRIAEVDLSYPIILAAEGWVMDGMHRVAKAMMEGMQEIQAVQFSRNPEPDEILWP